MTNQPQPQEQHTEEISFSEIGGWPATIGNRRLTKALNHLEHHGDTDPEDPQLAEDISMLMLMFATHLYPTTLDHRLDNLPDDLSSRMAELISIARAIESDQTFGGLMLATHDHNPDFLELRAVFALLRHPHWMGASTYLPHLKGLTITVFESHTRPGKPGIFVAAPFNDCQPSLNDNGFPPGEPELLRIIVMWHQAAACHWIPRHNDDGEGTPGPEPLPMLALSNR